MLSPLHKTPAWMPLIHPPSAHRSPELQWIGVFNEKAANECRFIVADLVDDFLPAVARYKANQFGRFRAENYVVRVLRLASKGFVTQALGCWDRSLLHA